jgi:hypothetical protein
MKNLFKKTEYRETKFSTFFREADTAERKKVFTYVIRKATEEQRRTLERT